MLIAPTTRKLLVVAQIALLTLSACSSTPSSTPLCDDFAGYKQSFTLGITEAGCLAHSRRKFFDLHVTNKSQIAEQALQTISQLYEVEREVKSLAADERRKQLAKSS